MRSPSADSNLQKLTALGQIVFFFKRDSLHPRSDFHILLSAGNQILTIN
jgi:hypothetical protein